MKKGFTLIEILAVVTIIGLIFILVIPKIATSLKNKKGDVDTTTNNIVLAAAKSYVADNRDKFDKEESNTYCLPISTLTKKEYLESPVKNVTDDVDITNTKTVKITYNKGFKYEIVDKKECSALDLKSEGYEKVEYIQSTGTQYIDTGIVPTKTTTIDMDIQFVSINGPYGVNGVRQTSNINTRFYPIATYNSSKYRCTFGNEEYYFDNPLERHHIIYNDINNNLYIDGNLEKTFNVDNINLEGTNTIWIFKANSENPANNNWFAEERIYSFKIIKDGILIRDYIPVIDKNIKPCLYEKKERKCYYNKNEGNDFLYNLNKKPKNYYYDKIGNKYSEYQFIESTGTQYIDTGIVPTKATTIDIDIQFTSTGANGANGVRQTSNFNTRFYPVVTYNSSKYRCTFGSEDYYFDNPLERHHIIYNDINHNLYIDDNLEKTFNVDNINLEGTNTVWIFKANSENPTNNNWFAKERIYSLKIIKDNENIRDFVPVVDENERPCLFDKIENKCYYNQGTGEFLWG